MPIQVVGLPLLFPQESGGFAIFHCNPPSLILAEHLAAERRPGSSSKATDLRAAHHDDYSVVFIDLQTKR